MIHALKYYVISMIVIVIGDFLGHIIGFSIGLHNRKYIIFEQSQTISILLIVCLAERLIENNKNN